MNIEQLAVQSGVIFVDSKSTYWTENNAIASLDKFAALATTEVLDELTAILDLSDDYTYKELYAQARSYIFNKRRQLSGEQND
jgi:hypothetical protein